MEDMLSTEHNPWHQEAPICSNTLDCHYKLKVWTLHLHVIALFPEVEVLCIVKLPATAKLYPLLIHIVDILPRYVVNIQEVAKKLKVMPNNCQIEVLCMFWGKTTRPLQVEVLIS